MVLFGESIVFVVWTIPLQDETPVRHDCFVVNGTSNFIINIPSRYGCWGVNVWSPRETVIIVLTYGHSPGSLDTPPVYNLINTHTNI